MGTSSPWDVLIVGGGMAGLSAAIWARRLGLSTLVLEREPDVGGQLHRIGFPIVDYPGLQPCRGALLAAQLKSQAAAAGAALRTTEGAQTLHVSARVCDNGGQREQVQALIIATGLSPRRLGVPGEGDLYRAQLVRRPSQEPDWFRTRRVAVIGGGDRAVENALLLAPLAGSVWLIHRRPDLSARPSLQARLREAPSVRLRLGVQVTEIAVHGPSATLALSDGSELSVDAVCPYIGNQPNTDLVRGQLDLDPVGYIRTDATGQTSAPGVYAVGDVRTSPHFQSLSTAAGQAMVAAKQIALNLGAHAPPH